MKFKKTSFQNYRTKTKHFAANVYRYDTGRCQHNPTLGTWLERQKYRLVDLTNLKYFFNNPYVLILQ